MEKQIVNLLVPKVILADAKQIAKERNEPRSAVLRRAIKIGIVELRMPKSKEEIKQ